MRQSIATQTGWGLIAAQVRPGLALIAVYVLLEWISFIHALPALPITPWQPGAGVALAVLLRVGASMVPWYFGAIVIAEWAVRGAAIGWLTLAAFAAIISSGYAIAATLLTKKLDFDRRLDRSKDVLLLVYVAMAAAAVVASSVATLFAAQGHIEFSSIGLAALRQGIGDVAGIAVVTPLLLRYPTFRITRIGPPLELATYAAIILFAVWIVFGFDVTDESKFFYLLFLPVVAVALRLGLDGATLALLVTQLGMLGFVQWRGLQSNTVEELQILVVLLTVTGLLVGVVVSERRNAEAKLQEKNAELAHIARINLLGEMTTALAHELNQPMAAMRAYTRAAERFLTGTPVDAAEAERAMRAAVLQVDHAAAIVKRLRDFMRKGHIRRSTVELEVITHEAMTFLRREAALASVVLRVEASNLPPIQADRVQLQQVLINLTRNAFEAIRATGKPGGEIRVTASANRESRRIEIAVFDTGGGVEPEQRDRLFEAFATTKPEGVGLGLSISRTIVEAHGGSLWLATTGPDGSEFRFTLPMGSR